MKCVQFLIVLLIGSIGWADAQTPYYMRPEFRNANSNWIFGRSMSPPAPPGSPASPVEDSAQHINFNTTPPTISRKLFWVPLARPGTRQATVTVSDRENGNLLFYTEGLHVYNRKQEIMPNGSGLLGDNHIMEGRYYRLGMHQGFCAVPVFDNRDRYYLFNLTHAGTNTIPAPSKLYYNIVDMSLDGGYGDVYKNIPLDTFQQTMFGEAIAAIPGDNCDVWLLLYDRGIMGYKAFHITDQGINPVPVISSSITGLRIFDMMQGRLAFSPDRKMIAMAYNYNAAIIGYPIRGGVVAKFDVATGLVSDEILIETDEGGSAAAFSPDNSKLYFASRTPVNGRLRLSQYDLSDYNVAAIRQSRYILDSTTGNYDDIRRRDDRLLVAGIGDRIGVIMHPDRKGAACDLRHNYFAVAGIVTNDTTINTMSLGNDVVFPLPPATFQVKALDTFICRVDKNTGLLLQAAQGGVDYVWDNGQTVTSRNVTGQGTYWVRYDKGCNTYVDTFTIRESAYPPPVIMVDGNRLYTSDDYELYQWFRNDTLIGNSNSYEFIAEHNANYHVVVRHKDGCTEHSGKYIVNNLSITDADVTAISVYPNPASDMVYIQAPGSVRWLLRTIDGRLLLQSAVTTSLSLKEVPRGVYMLEVWNENDSSPLKVVRLIKK